VANSLNSLSEKLAKALQLAYPLWEIDYSALAQEDGAFTVEVPSPHPGNSPLWISTDREEITIGFGDFHTHIPNYEEDNQKVEEAIQQINDIIAENEVGYSLWDGEKFQSASLQEPNIDPEWGKITAERIQPGWILRCQSWTGKFNKETVYS
jgi:hypothetical protein